MSYTYDLLGRMLTAKFGSGRGITNSFNSVGEMLSTATDMSGAARTLSYQYDVAGRRTRVTHPDGQFFTYQFDTLNRVKGIFEGTSTSLVTIAYDDLGRRTSLSRSGAGTTSYTYDPVSRLASLTQNLAGSANDLVIDQIAYNPASQIVSQRRAPDAYAWTGHTDGTIPTTPNGLNQIATKDATAYTYDANGNLTSDGTWTYTYDTENRLKGADSAAGGVNLFYDPLGRLWQISGGLVVDMQFVNDGIDLALEYRISSGSVERRYVHGGGVDEPLVQYEGASLATKRHLHADERGSIVATTDAAGANPAINRYDEFGLPQSTNSGRFGYTGQAWLKEIGLYYYKARMYSPTGGVFLQPDLIGYLGGMNQYAYVGNDPVNFVDPLGMERVCVAPTGSHIRSSCVGVDGDGDGFISDNDLTVGQTNRLARDFYSFILDYGTASGLDISFYGRATFGLGSDYDISSVRAVTQFVGAAIAFEGSSSLKSAWNRVDFVYVGSRELSSRAGWSRWQDHLQFIVITGRGGGSQLQNFYSSPSNLARILLHETLHGAYPGHARGGLHHRLDLQANASSVFRPWRRQLCSSRWVRRMLKNLGLHFVRCLCLSACNWSSPEPSGVFRLCSASGNNDILLDFDRNIGTYSDYSTYIQPCQGSERACISFPIALSAPPSDIRAAGQGTWNDGSITFQLSEHQGEVQILATNRKGGELMRTVITYVEPAGITSMVSVEEGERWTRCEGTLTFSQLRNKIGDLRGPAG